MQSSVYLNASRTHEQSKRGTYVMKNRAWLVEKYGEGVADSIIENKRQMQLKRKNTDPQYVMENPDIPGSKETFLELRWIPMQPFKICLQSQKNHRNAVTTVCQRSPWNTSNMWQKNTMHYDNLPLFTMHWFKEHEMYRVFDGLSFEDSETNRFTTGFSSSGQLSEDQTREFMWLVFYF